MNKIITGILCAFLFCACGTKSQGPLEVSFTTVDAINAAGQDAIGKRARLYLNYDGPGEGGVKGRDPATGTSVYGAVRPSARVKLHDKLQNLAGNLYLDLEITHVSSVIVGAIIDIEPTN